MTNVTNSKTGGNLNARQKYMQCLQCGCNVIVGIRRKRPIRCPECGLAEAIDAAIQMRHKMGPYYEKWLANGGRKGRPRKGGTPISSDQKE